MRNIIFAAFVLGACGGGPPPQCPATAPATGDACDSTPPICYYADACTGDGMGVLASCTSGRFEVGYDAVVVSCPKQPVSDGDPCPCALGSRQRTPCSWTLPNGQTETAACDGKTLTWKITS